MSDTSTFTINTIHIVTNSRTPCAKVSTQALPISQGNLSPTQTEYVRKHQGDKGSFIMLPKHENNRHLFSIFDSNGVRTCTDRDIRTNLIQNTGLIFLPVDKVLFCTIGVHLLFFLNKFKENESEPFLHFDITSNTDRSQKPIFNELKRILIPSVA